MATEVDVMIWMRAALVAVTAIGRHLLENTHSASPSGWNVPTVSGTPSTPSTELIRPSHQDSHQAFAQVCPFNVTLYPGELVPCQEAMKPKARSAPAATVLL
ncbi:hypothetical protein SAMN06272735_6652 [Streptomyces sp. TLI_55]|nr:hypothetical protein SAMN06272735_6652 [Streptomyces sp. TLI_55]